MFLFALVVTTAGVAFAQTAAKDAVPPPSNSIARWLDAQYFQGMLRYHFVDPETPTPEANQLQSWEALRFRLKADAAGRVAVAFGFSSGPSFVGSWNDTGVGTGNTRLHVSLRLLSLDVAPVRGVTVQAGSLQLARGESTEITTFDNDGYLTGERVTVRRPKTLFFDEISIAQGYVGDANEPSVFDRTDRLGDHNYQQYLVARHIQKRVFASGDFTRWAGANIVHAAARVQSPELRALDSIRYEQYVRTLSGKTVAGFAVTGEKQVARPLVLSGGYADIDKDFGGLNADRFNRGRRVFGIATYTVSPVLSVMTYAGQAVHNDYPVSNGTRIDVTLIYNILGHMQRAGWLPAGAK
jgi:hypothetical protein